MNLLGWCIWAMVAFWWISCIRYQVMNTSGTKISSLQMEISEKSEGSVESRRLGAFATPIMSWMRGTRLLGMMSNAWIFTTLLLTAVTDISKFHLLWLAPLGPILVLVISILLFGYTMRKANWSALKEDT